MACLGVLDPVVGCKLALAMRYSPQNASVLSGPNLSSPIVPRGFFLPLIGFRQASGVVLKVKSSAGPCYGLVCWRSGLCSGKLVNKHPLGFCFSHAEPRIAHANFYWVTQRCPGHHLYGVAFQQSHFLQSASNMVITLNGQYSATLSGN